MSSQLQQAITHIKSGKKQKAQQLLQQILKNEPDNEQAWLWMSAAVPEDKRRYCLEKALSINPNNQQTKQALAKLVKIEATSVASSSPPSPPKPSLTDEVAAHPAISRLKNLSQPAEPVSPVLPLRDMPQPDPPEAGGDKATPKFWVHKQSKIIYVTALFEQELVSGTIDPGAAKKLQAKLQQGDFSMDMLKDRKVVPFQRITEVSQTMTSIRVYYTESTTPRSTRLESKDEEMAEAIINALEKRLGAKFERTATPMGRGKISIISSIVMMIFLGITTFCYFGSIEVASGNVSAMGSARTRGMIGWLGLLGPNGVACISGVLFLLILIVIIYYLANPPLVTKLAPK